MKLLALVLLAQASAASAPPPVPAQEAAPSPVPYARAIDQGLAELREHSLSEHHDEAAELALSLLAAPAFAALPEALQARVQHDIGVALARAGLAAEAVAAFHSACALAGAGELRRDASYDAGTVLLEEAEILRLQVPEIAQKLGAPAPTAPPSTAPGSGAEAADPLETARGAYLAARAVLIERLRLDWRDEDTRANVELCVRRLRELDEVEREREEQQSRQDASGKDQEQQQQPDSKDQQKGNEQDQQPKDQQGEQQPDQDPSKPQQDPKSGDPKDEGQEQPQPDPSEKPPAEEQSDPKDEPKPGEQEERVLTREEVLRLLDRLEAIDEQARAVRALLRERRRKPVEKDW